MNIVLNSRVLVGQDHVAADRYARQWRPGLAKDIEWMQSPSELCVLSITRAKDETIPGESSGTKPAAPSAASQSPGKRPRRSYPAPLAMTNALEDELRHHLGLKLPVHSPH